MCLLLPLERQTGHPDCSNDGIDFVGVAALNPDSEGVICSLKLYKDRIVEYNEQ